MSRSSLDGGQTDGGGPDDKTAEDLFRELADDESGLGTSADGDDIYEELSDASPEEIIAAADETVDEPAVDEAILPDEDALDDLLLSERTMADGFLWVETTTEPVESEPNDDDVVEEWSDAFAEASALGGDDADDDDAADGAPAIEIEVPDPEEVEGATTDDSSTVDPDPASAANRDPQAETDADGGEDGATESDDFDAATEPSVDEDDGGDADDRSEPTDGSESSTDGEAAAESSTDDRDKYDRIFDVDPDEDALSRGESDGGGDDGGDSDDDRGLLARILALLPL